tara:strand:- start:1154 stop:1603 length:450 start_codon:yes stop_codon:yes gene_type:complete
MSSFSLSKSDIAYMESLQLLADLYYKITGDISRGSWLTVWMISAEVADVEENYDTDPEWGDERIPELKELNSEDNSLQCFLNTDLDDFQEDEDCMEKYFQIGKGESCSYSTIEEFIADVEFEKVSNINKEALKLSQSQSKMDELRDIVR